MEDLQNILVDIERKVRQLAFEKVNLEEVLHQKNLEIDNLKREIKQLKESNNNLNKEVQGTENIINNNSDLTEYRLIIDDLLSKIDRSITLASAEENTDNI